MRAILWVRSVDVESAFVLFSTTPFVATHTHTQRYTIVSAAHVLFSVHFKYTIVLLMHWCWPRLKITRTRQVKTCLCVQLFELIALWENLSIPCQTALLASRARQKCVRFWAKNINRKIGSF
jgi:hypothetical protein